MDWYRLEIDEIFEQLKSSPEGLTEAEAEERLRRYGPNQLAEEEPISKLQILLHQFTSPLIYILLLASLVTAAFREFVDTGVILAVVILNAIIGYIQEYKAEESVRALQKLAVPKARVLREGKEKEIPSELLVPGDIVLLASGSKVPADLRLFKTLELRVDEATLTGESVPSEKFAHTMQEEHLTPGDQENIAFMGTVVVNGRGRGIVVETGGRAVLGQIAGEVRELSATRAPLLEKMGQFARFIGLLTLAGAAAILLLGLFLGMRASTLFMTAVAASVATIPEGLPIVVTITLAIGISRMAKRNAIIRKLPAVETLGSTTVICTDKTGTLTKNEMTVRALYDGETVYEVTGAGYQPEGEIVKSEGADEAPVTEGLKMVLRIGMLCNESDLYEEEGRIKVDGDPTEGALIVSAIKGGLHPEEERERYPQLAIVPFESERGYMATLHEHGGE
ncbi:MAG: HAD-IC family P-type ATPase, partial [candidate division NC10 bacterium]|nr:HAD-IC family P-type ATPase [candidate division NC10 bacterium]